jgi:hypothetical protein
MALDFPTSPENNQVYNNYYYDSLAGVWRSLGGVYGPSFLKNPTFTTGTTTGVPVTVQGITSQTSNLQEWKKEDNTTLASIDKNGNLNLTGTNSTTDSRTLSIDSLGYAGVRLNPDTSNAGGEPGGAFLSMGGDAVKDLLILSSIQNSGYSGIDDSSLYAGTTANSALLGTIGSRNLHFGTNGIVRVTVDLSGRVSTPYQPSFLAYRPGGNNFTQGTGDLPFNATKHNTGGHYNTSNYRFTAPVAGTYFFSLHFNVYSTSGVVVQGSFMINGATQYSGNRMNTAGGDQDVTASVSVYLNAGDYVNSRSNLSTSMSFSSNEYWTHFSGHFLG